MIIYGLKSCDNCRKARAALNGFAFQDLRETPITRDMLSTAFDHFGAALVNTRSTTWRGLDDAARTSDPLDLLEAHPTVMKRPLIAKGDKLYLGWGADVQSALIQTSGEA